MLQFFLLTTPNYIPSDWLYNYLVRQHDTENSWLQSAFQGNTHRSYKGRFNTVANSAYSPSSCTSTCCHLSDKANRSMTHGCSKTAIDWQWYPCNGCIQLHPFESPPLSMQCNLQQWHRLGQLLAPTTSLLRRIRVTNSRLFVRFLTGSFFHFRSWRTELASFHFTAAYIMCYRSDKSFNFITLRDRQLKQPS